MKCGHSGPFFTKDLETIEVWLESFKNLEFNKKSARIVWLDIAYDKKVTDLLHSFIREHQNEYREFIYLDSSLKKLPNMRRGVKGYDDYTRKRTVAESMQIINKHRKGNMVVWEDDIIAPRDAFRKMEKVFSNPPIKSKSKIRMVTCCQYWETSIKNPKVWIEKDASGNKAEEMEKGYDLVSYTATGFVLLDGKFLDGYDYCKNQETFMAEYKNTDRFLWGQDYVLSYYINKKSTQKNIIVDWSVKTIHIRYNEKFKNYFLRSGQCKTVIPKIKGQTIIDPKKPFGMIALKGIKIYTQEELSKTSRSFRQHSKIYSNIVDCVKTIFEK